jgi:hypothetical protein
MYTTYCGIPIKKMKDKELINLVKDLYEAIYITDCYGAKDIPLLGDLMFHLHTRGYQIEENSKLCIRKN